MTDPADRYEAWHALFVVLAEPEAKRPLEALAARDLWFGDVRRVATKFLRDERTASNARGIALMEKAIRDVRDLVSDEVFERYQAVAALLEPDLSGCAARSGAWLHVLRAWTVANEPKYPALTSPLQAAIEIAAPEETDFLEVEWWFLVDGAQAKLVSQAVATYAASVLAAEREALFRDAQATAAEMGVLWALDSLPNLS